MGINEQMNLEKDKDTNYSLIINYLPQSIKENHLIDIFSQIGPLKYSKLMFDKQTGYSYGFAFIQYINGEQHAKIACEKLNGLQIAHKRIKVTLARPQSNETRNTRLYIKGFPPEFDEKEFSNLFKPFGEIIQIRILNDKLIAFVIMSTRTQAKNALDNINGLQIDQNSILNVKFTDGDSRRRHMANALSSPPIHYYPYPFLIDQYYFGSPPINSNCSIYVYGLSEVVSESELYRLFCQFGDVIRVSIILDNKRGVSKGYGFVSMSNCAECLFAIKELNNFPFYGRYLQVRFKTCPKKNC